MCVCGCTQLMHADTYVYISPKVNVHTFIIENLSDSKSVHQLPF